MLLFWYGMLIGWGVAIPFGPINLEIVRRNLTYGTRYGLAFGFGACAVDGTYMLLFSLGVLAILADPAIIKIIGCIGAMVLIWFGIKALRAKPLTLSNATAPNKRIWRHFADSYLLTMSSPFTLIFWTSISSQLGLLARSEHHALAWMVAGVLFGTLVWEIALNSFLHFTRHRLPASLILWLNRVGGIILIGMAIFSLLYVFIHL
ncbi:MAG: LysE family translocator [Gammaproteobacteria bacterium]|nr:LysE family translocator [Gammaproteobacteria bacterium]